MDQTTYTAVFLFFLIFGVVTTTIMIFSKNPFLWSYLIMTSLVGIGGVQVYLASASLRELGVYWPDLSEVGVYALVAIVSTLIIFVMSRFMKSPEGNSSSIGSYKMYFAFYVVFSAPVQEAIFRSYLYYSLEFMAINSVVVMALISSLLFMYPHFFIRNKLINVGTLAFGLVWAVTYFYVPNLLLVILLHGIMGLAAQQSGLVGDALIAKMGNQWTEHLQRLKGGK